MALVKSKKSKSFVKRKTKCSYSKAKRGGSKKTTKKHIKKAGKKSSRKFKGGGNMTAETKNMLSALVNEGKKRASEVKGKGQPSNLGYNEFTHSYMESFEPRNSLIIKQPAELSVHTRNAINGNSDPSALDNAVMVAHPDRVVQQRRAAKEAATVAMASKTGNKKKMAHMLGKKYQTAINNSKKRGMVVEGMNPVEIREAKEWNDAGKALEQRREVFKKEVKKKAAESQNGGSKKTTKKYAKKMTKKKSMRGGGLGPMNAKMGPITVEEGNHSAKVLAATLNKQIRNNMITKAQNAMQKSQAKKSSSSHNTGLSNVGMTTAQKKTLNTLKNPSNNAAFQQAIEDAKRLGLQERQEYKNAVGFIPAQEPTNNMSVNNKNTPRNMI
uniref:Uncharacterized protein n=1 Tax=Florenciella sp. virus SA2 TaxID=3240092 RepID=A0AB39J9U7_9VIRU